MGDALIGIAYGVVLFGEHLRLGVWLVPELISMALIVIGYAEIARSPLASGHHKHVESTPLMPARALATANGPTGGGAGDPA